MPGKVTFTVDDYIENLLEEALTDMGGMAVTLVGNNLFTINDNAEKLDAMRSDEYH
jgi:hypothetical protein